MKGCVSNGTLTNRALAKQTHKRTQLENLDLLANPFGQVLRTLALTCDDLRSFRDQICTQVDASFFPSFGHPTQVNATIWVTTFSLLLANEVQHMPALNGFLRFACNLLGNLRVVWPYFAPVNKPPATIQCSSWHFILQGLKGSPLPDGGIRIFSAALHTHLAG